MNKLQEQRLKRLNSLLMEQDVPPSIRRARNRRADRGESKPAPAAAKEDDDGFLSEATNTIVSLYGVKQANNILMAVIKKAGPEGAELAKALEGGTKASRSARVLSFFRNLGPRGVALSKRIAQETVMTLARRGPSRAVLTRIMSNPSIARFIATRLGISLLPSGAPIGSATAALATTGGQTAVGAAGASSVAGYILLGAGAGAAIGYGLNSIFGASDIEGETKERIDKANEDINYAIAELDVYCSGKGSLCGDEVICNGKGGGYIYDLTGELPWYLSLGRGAGREKFGLVPGLRKFKQSPDGAWKAIDGVMLIALGAALARDDLKNGRIELPSPNEKDKSKRAKFKADALSKKYEKCIVGTLTKSNIMLNAAKKMNVGPAYESLQLVYGLKALPQKLPDPDKKEKKPGPTPAGPTKCDQMPITKGCTGGAVSNAIHIATYGTKGGTDALAKDEKFIAKLKEKQTLDDETIKYLSSVLPQDVVKKWISQNYTIESGSDLARWFDEIATKYNLMAEGKTNVLNENIDFYARIRSNKYSKIQTKLMERIK
jgi:hypothetical protein